MPKHRYPKTSSDLAYLKIGVQRKIMIQIEVNGRTIKAEAGEMILSAIKRVGISVPTLCYYEGLSPVGRCRICVVEVDGRKDLVPACSSPVSEGMRIRTHSKRVLEARKNILELMHRERPKPLSSAIPT